MVNKYCYKCGMEFSKTSNYKRHLNKKIDCKPSIDLISVADDLKNNNVVLCSFVQNSCSFVQKEKSDTINKNVTIINNKNETLNKIENDNQILTDSNSSTKLDLTYLCK
jgi:hypothetical protein